MAPLLRPDGLAQRKPPFGRLLDRAHPLARGLVAAYAMNDTGSALLNDAAGPNNATFDAPPVWSAGESGPIVDCTTTGKSLTIPATVLSQVTTGFTVFMRLYSNTGYADYGALMDAGGSSTTRQLSLFLRTNGNLFMALGSNGGGDYILSPPLLAATWQNFALTYVVGAVTATAYVDGVLASAANTPAGSTFNAAIRLNANPTGGGGAWHGKFACLYFYNRVLTQREITQLQAEPFGIYAAPPGRRWATFLVAPSHAYTQGLAGVLTLSGALGRGTSRALAAVLATVGTFSKGTGLPLSASLTLVGGRRVQTFPLTLPATPLGPTGSLLGRALGRGFAGSLALSGSMARAIGRALTASATLSGLLASAKNGGTHAYFATLTAVLTLSGAIRRSSSRILPTALLSLTGTAAKASSRAVVAVLSFAGGIGKATTRIIAASLTLAGTTRKGIARALADAALILSGAIATSKNGVGHAYTQSLNAVLAFTTAFATSKNGVGTAYFATLGAVLAVSGAIRRSTARGLSASANVSGAVSRGTSRLLAATATFAGAITRSIATPLSAALTMTGAAQRGIIRALAAVVSSVGIMSAPLNGAHHYLQNLSASLALSGGVRKGIGRGLSAAVGFFANLFSPNPHADPKTYMLTGTAYALDTASGTAYAVDTISGIAVAL